MFHILSYRSSRIEEHLTPNQVEFSPARYEPMGRLLDDRDLQFLKSQPGFRPEMGKKFIRERRRILRLYLQELAADFHRLHAHARAMVASLPAEHSALVGMLIRQQVRFWYEMAAIEMSLSLDLMGRGTARARGLISALAAMHAEIGQLAVTAAC